MKILNRKCISIRDVDSMREYVMKQMVEAILRMQNFVDNKIQLLIDQKSRFTDYLERAKADLSSFDIA